MDTLMKIVVVIAGIGSVLFLTSNMIKILQPMVDIYKRSSKLSSSKKAWLQFQIIGIAVCNLFACVFIGYMIFLGFFR